jgi:hypothetical protein
VYYLKKLEKERRRKSFFDSEFDVRTVCYACIATTRLVIWKDVSMVIVLVGDPERIEGCPRQDEEWQCVARTRPEPPQGVEQARAPDADGQCEVERSQEREHGSEG